MATKNERSSHPQALLDLYDQLIAAHPDIERKGATMPYTSLNGNMFSYISKEGELAIRLSKEDIADFLTTHNTKLMEAYGIVQKEYAVVPAALINNPKKLQTYFDKSVAYVRTLKAKGKK